MPIIGPVEVILGIYLDSGGLHYPNRHAISRSHHILHMYTLPPTPRRDHPYHTPAYTPTITHTLRHIPHPHITSHIDHLTPVSHLHTSPVNMHFPLITHPPIHAATLTPSRPSHGDTHTHYPDEHPFTSRQLAGGPERKSFLYTLM